MNLATTYVGFRLPHPFIVGSGPMTDDIGMVRQLEDAGAAAFVLCISTPKAITTPSPRPRATLPILSRRPGPTSTLSTCGE